MKQEKAFILKGDLCWSTSVSELATMDDGYLVVEDGIIAGVFKQIPECYQALPLIDTDNALIMPGMIQVFSYHH